LIFDNHSTLVSTYVNEKASEYLEHLHGRSILHSRIGGRKPKVYWFGSGKWFWLSIIACIATAGEKRFTMADKKRSNAMHLQKRV
jgi:hypothetical protein